MTEILQGKKYEYGLDMGGFLPGEKFRSLSAIYIFCKANQKSARPGQTELSGFDFMIGSFYLLPGPRWAY